MPPAPLDVPKGDVSNLRGVTSLSCAYTNYPAIEDYVKYAT